MNQKNKNELLNEAIKDFAAATGIKETEVRSKIGNAIRGKNASFKAWGIDLTGIIGKTARMDFLIKEIKNKFTAQ